MMETKPYNLQSPEQIAKDYGGNKQKIAEAMQMGIIDPTAGTLAAMFIDRMRSAAQTEAAPQQSVAQQVFAPPAPQMPMGMPPMPPMPQGAPAGLGATPQAAAMPAPAAAPPMGMPMEQPMPGMAAGGLAALSVPDGMFDEPTNGGFDDGYRSGGLVAFARGDLVDDEEEVPARLPSLTGAEIGGDVMGVTPDEITVVGRRPEPPEMVPEPAGPDEYYGTFRDPFRMQERITELAPQSTERRGQFNKFLEKMLDPEEQKKRRQEDMWMTLGQIGARMATTPGSLLQAASTGIAEALPGVRAAAKERRGEERAAISELAKNEGLSNADAREFYKLIQAGTDQYGRFNEARLNREQQDKLTRLEQARADYRAELAARAGITQQQIAAAATTEGNRLQRQATMDTAFSNYLGSAGGTIAFNGLVANGATPGEALATLRSSFFDSGNVTRFDSKGNPIK
jgi:hypothetical protein